MSTDATPPLNPDDANAVLAQLQAQGLAPADEPATPMPAAPTAPEPAPTPDPAATATPPEATPAEPTVPTTDVKPGETPAEAAKRRALRARFDHNDVEFDLDAEDQEKRAVELIQLGMKAEKDERKFQRELEQERVRAANESAQRTIAWFQSQGIAVMPDVDSHGTQRKDAAGNPMWRAMPQHAQGSNGHQPAPAQAPAAAPAPATIPGMDKLAAVRKLAEDTEDVGLLQTVEGIEATLTAVFAGLKPAETLTKEEAKALATAEAQRLLQERDTAAQQAREAEAAKARDAEAYRVLEAQAAAQVAKYDQVFKATADPDHWRGEAMRLAVAAAFSRDEQGNPLFATVEEAVPYMAGAVGTYATKVQRERDALMRSLGTNQQPRVAAPPVPAAGGVPAQNPKEIDTKDPHAVLAYLQRQGLAPAT